MTKRKDSGPSMVKQGSGQSAKELKALLDANGGSYNAVAHLAGMSEMTVRRRIQCAGLHITRRIRRLPGGRSSNYACKADERPLAGAKQPVRLPECRYYDRCLSACKPSMGMNCLKCQRFEQGDGVDPVRTNKGYAPMAPLRGPFTRTEVAERPSEKVLGM